MSNDNIPEGLGENQLQQVVERMTEADFNRIFYLGGAKFGYSGTFFQRGDIFWEDGDGNWVEEISDEEWENVRNSWEWR